MKVILISSIPNQVSNQLSRFLSNNLYVINCKGKRVFSKSELKNLILSFSPDIIITYRCPYILPKELFCYPKYGSYNIHPSLLPLYPGLNPWEAIFANHETQNGVTLHRITENIDQGEIIFQEKYLISHTDNILSARNKADVIAAELALKLILLNAFD